MAKYEIKIDTQDTQKIAVFLDGKEIPVFSVKYSFEQNDNYPEERSNVEFEIVHGDDNYGVTRLHTRSGVAVDEEVLGQGKTLDEII